MLAIAASLLAPRPALSQQTIRLYDRPPDCYLQFGPLTAAGASADLDNRASGCAEWTLTYSSSGFSVISIDAQSAPTNAGGTGPGVYVSLVGTLTAGVSPNTSIKQSETDYSGAYNPWVRVNLATATGTGIVYGVIYGWRTTPAVKTNVLSSTVVVGAAAAGFPLSGAPVNVGTSDGATVIQPFICTTQQLFNLAASGNTQIIAAATGGKSIKVCHIDFATTAAEDVKITSGTGANCVTGTTDITGLYKSVQFMSQDYTASAALRLGANQAMCINQSAAQALGGVIIYAVW